MRSGGLSAGSSGALLLDPFALPLRFAARDAATDGRVRHIELHRERVVVRRCLAGMRMAVNMPVSAFAGVSIRTMPGEGDTAATVAVVLEHKDPGLALPVFISTEAGDAMAQWRTWAHVLGLPLLVTEIGGGWREPFARIGGVTIGKVRQRRRRHNAIKRRRPTQPLRRRFARLSADAKVHRGEREIIARN